LRTGVAEPDLDRGDVNGASVDIVAFVGAHGHCAESLELVEGTLGGVAIFAGDRIEGRRPQFDREPVPDMHGGLGSDLRRPAPVRPGGRCSGPVRPPSGQAHSGEPGQLAEQGILETLVDGTHAWMNGYGKLRCCAERNAKIVDFYLYLAAALVTIRQLIQRARNRYRWIPAPLPSD
jgi:hypothetical protein